MKDMKCQVCGIVWSLEPGSVSQCNGDIAHCNFGNFVMDQVFASPARDPLLVEREKTHGSFGANANVWNTMLRAMQGAPPMKAEHSLALHMIFVKLSRALQTPNVKEHWDDIAGYAKLGAEACDNG